MGVLKKIFAPNDKKFYLLFEDAILNLVQMSATFSEVTVEEDKLKYKEHIKAILAFDQANEKLTHKMLIELAGNLITPFDREDIHALASSLDNIADHIVTTARLMGKYDVSETKGASHQVASELVKFVTLLEKTIRGLSNKSGLNQLASTCIEMRDIIHQSDELIDDKIAELFNSKRDINVVIRYKDHYDLLQDLLEDCVNAINVIEAVIIKYN